MPENEILINSIIRPNERIIFPKKNMLANLNITSHKFKVTFKIPKYDFKPPSSTYTPQSQPPGLMVGLVPQQCLAYSRYSSSSVHRSLTGSYSPKAQLRLQHLQAVWSREGYYNLCVFLTLVPGWEHWGTEFTGCVCKDLLLIFACCCLACR